MARNWDETSSKSNIKDGSSRVSRTFLHLPTPVPSPYHTKTLSPPESCEAEPKPADALLLGCPPPPRVSVGSLLLRIRERATNPSATVAFYLMTEGHRYIHARGLLSCPENHALPAQLSSGLRAARATDSTVSVEKTPLFRK